MSTTTVLTGQHTFMPFSKGGRALSIVEDTSAQAGADADRLLQLSTQLQASLDIEEILECFSDEIKPYLPHNSLSYKLENNADQHNTEQPGEQQPMEYSTGINGRHRLNYQLSINEKNLGSLQITRKTKFSDAETAEAEHMICALLYPLRNAIMYRAALKAAHKDALTGAGNRAAFDEALRRHTELAQRHGRTLGMIMIDIDHFKKINDTHGHAAGDCLLKTLAQTAGNTIRSSDQLFRYGGEEFVVLLPETSTTGAKRLADRIRRNVESVDWMCNGKHIKMTASFGVAILKDEEKEKDFFNRADEALYQAKAEGRNCTRMAK